MNDVLGNWMLMAQQSPSWWKQAGVFALNFVKHPTMSGSLIPSSRFLIRRLLSQIDWRTARVIVEYGPGAGTITAHMLRRMRFDATLVVFEMNDDFAHFLRREFSDPRLHIVHGSAADVRDELARRGFDHADYIVSGIPFSTMPTSVRESILHTSRALLQPGGTFLVYQFSPAVKPYLQQAWGTVEDDWEPLNILPARIYRCTN
jgi:phospholipid N-methyltransferase